jgi:methyl-accepting chemotaxis protein
MRKKANKRDWKNILINRKIQFRIIAINLICMSIAVGINTAVMFSSSVCNIYYSDDSGLLKFIDMYTLSSEVLNFSLAVIFVLAIISQMLLTHKICGPLVNFTNSYNKMSEGDLTRPVRLRSGDLLVEEAKQFNAMISDLSKHIEALSQDNRNLLEQLKELSADSADPGKLEQAREFLKENEQSILTHLERLKLPNSSDLSNGNVASETVASG